MPDSPEYRSATRLALDDRRMPGTEYADFVLDQIVELGEIGSGRFFGGIGFKQGNHSILHSLAAIRTVHMSSCCSAIRSFSSGDRIPDACAKMRWIDEWSLPFSLCRNY